MRTTLVAIAQSRIWGTTNSWSLDPHRGRNEPHQECQVRLEIQGDDESGYHLVMTPTGFFTADSWHATKDEVLKAAETLFGVGRDEWKISN